jgi:hypothetical protein
MDGDSIHQHGGLGNYFKSGTAKKSFGDTSCLIRYGGAGFAFFNAGSGAKKADDCAKQSKNSSQI